MTDPVPTTSPTDEKLPKEALPLWLSRTIIAVVAAAVLVLAYLIASVTVPLVWANSIRDQVGGQLGNSIPLGMFYGFVFTFVPVLLLWQARRRKLNKWVRLVLLVVSLVLLVPNILTLTVLYANTQTAVDARAIWAISANWFGTWSQVFMLAGIVCAIAVIYFGRLLLARGRKLRELKAAERLVRAEEKKRARANRKTPAPAPAQGTESDPASAGGDSGGDSGGAGD